MKHRRKARSILARGRAVVGIDIGKRKHAATALSPQGEIIAQLASFPNTREGVELLEKEVLRKAGGPRKVLVAMEATGHYWYALRDFLVGKGYEVVVLNPIQTKQQARKDIRKRKTDRIDARHIARLLKNGGHKVALVPGDFAMTCRQLTRLRYKLIGQVGRLKQLLWSRLHPCRPGSDCFGRRL